MACQLAHLLLIWAAATSATPLPRTNQTATPPPAWSDVSVQTTFGWLHGRLFERHAEFLGVPYATNERFEPAADWSESFTPFLGRQATKAAPACPQAPGILPADDPTDEHCERALTEPPFDLVARCRSISQHFRAAKRGGGCQGEKRLRFGSTVRNPTAHRVLPLHQ